MSERGDGPMKSPLEWLLTVCLIVMGCAIALTVAVDLLQRIWPWLVGIGLLAGAIYLTIRVLIWRRRTW
jgi:hypothetical protein